MLVASALPHMNILAKLKFNLSKKIFFLTLICTGILSLTLALQPDPIKTQTYKINHSPAPSAPASSKPHLTKPSAPSSIPNPPAHPTPSPISDQQEFSPQTTSTPQPTSTTTYEVNVSINGLPNFTVSVNEGSNQCDVLSKSLEQGKIGSLNMKYDKNYETYAVYQINGIGKENSVWWVYTVNGKSPSKGCSHIKVDNNDNAEWKYLGS